VICEIAQTSHRERVQIDSVHVTQRSVASDEVIMKDFIGRKKKQDSHQNTKSGLGAGLAAAFTTGRVRPAIEPELEPTLGLGLLEAAKSGVEDGSRGVFLSTEARAAASSSESSGAPSSALALVARISILQTHKTEKRELGTSEQ
jgi:hypothetical protein